MGAIKKIVEGWKNLNMAAKKEEQIIGDDKIPTSIQVLALIMFRDVKKVEGKFSLTLEPSKVTVGAKEIAAFEAAWVTFMSGQKKDADYKKLGLTSKAGVFVTPFKIQMLRFLGSFVLMMEFKKSIHQFFVKGTNEVRTSFLTCDGGIPNLNETVYLPRDDLGDVELDTEDEDSDGNGGRVMKIKVGPGIKITMPVFYEPYVIFELIDFPEQI